MRRRRCQTRWAISAALALLAAGTMVAIYAGYQGATYTDKLDQAHPALGEVEPYPGVAGPRRSRQVVIAVVDGLRLDASREMRFLESLRARGVSIDARSQYPTYSIPTYVNLLTGVPPAASGVRTNRFPGTVSLDTVMNRARQAGLHAGYAGDYDPMPRLFLRPREPGDALFVDDVRMIDDYDPETAARALMAGLRGDFDDAHYAPWAGGFWDSAEQILASDDALVVLLIGVVDVAGHEHGGDSDEYRQAVQSADLALERVFASVDLTQDTVIVVADHGHTDRGGHGGLEREVVDVPLVIAGAGVVAGSPPPLGVELQDVAPTAARLLGLAPPGHALGRSLVEILDLPDDLRAAAIADDGARIARNREVVATARAIALADREDKRDSRLLMLAGALVALVAGIGWLWTLGGVRFDWRSLAIGVPAFFGVYYILIATLGQRFSPSLVPAEGQIVTELIKYGVAATILQVAAGWVAQRHHLRLADRLAAANGIAAVGLVVALLPAAVVWARYPAPYVDPPGPALLVLIPAVSICVACYVIGIALSLAVELLVFIARKFDPRVRSASRETPSASSSSSMRARRRGAPPPRRRRLRLGLAIARAPEAVPGTASRS